MLKKFSERFGFTLTEISDAAFLLIILLVGFGYQTFFKEDEDQSYKKFDYSREDSLFISAGSEDSTAEEENSISASTGKNNVLELNKNSSAYAAPKKNPAEKSINLNTATIESFAALPGIGKKTAQRIMELRNRLGKFRGYDDLLQVKGIGNARLEKIKKYTYIE